MYIYEEDISHLHLGQEPEKKPECSNPRSSFSQNIEVSIYTQGDELYLKPSSPCTFSSVPQESQASLLNPFEISEEEIPSHKRTCTTIINDVAQSYTFVPTIDKESGKSTNNKILLKELFEEHEKSMKYSMMASTADPKSFMKRLERTKEKNSTIFTISSNSSSKSFVNMQDSYELKIDSSGPQRDSSLLMSIIAFCNKCQENIPTEVVEHLQRDTMYGIFRWKKLLCNLCYGDPNVREFTHICKYCREPLFQIKFRIE